LLFLMVKYAPETIAKNITTNATKPNAKLNLLHKNF
jgi:hypothetical protein